MYDAFYPGQVWLDTEGKRIHAHGGSIITVNGMYYLYGENKERSLPGTGIWHWGVRLYSSTDLYNWKDEGLILPPAQDPAIPCTTPSIWTGLTLFIMRKPKSLSCGARS